MGQALDEFRAAAAECVEAAQPAPRRFSIVKAIPCDRPICSASTRARTSLAPPGGTGTMILTVVIVCGHAALIEGTSKLIAIKKLPMVLIRHLHSCLRADGDPS